MSTVATGIFEEVSNGFFLDETKVRKIVDIIKNHGDKLENNIEITYRVYKKNNSFKVLTDVDELLSLDNSNETRVRRILIELKELKKDSKSGRDDSQVVFSLDFDKEHHVPVIYTIKHENREWMLLLLDEIKSQVSRVERFSLSRFLDKRIVKYISCAGGAVLISFIVSLLMPVSFLEYIVGAEITEENKVNFIMMKFILMSFLCFFLFLVSGSIVDTSSRRFSIDSVFYFGDEIRIHDRTKDIQSKVIWGVGVAIVVSVIASWVGKEVLG
ncbi:hypothetical protein CGJ21_24305 [Vibrio parahaemolyticus]|uniref:hypothetical protein n=1 Tax=Vibrio parahaemolyticus TaxID=670 RepID=UPI001120D310|nr:hypothetical protein [Vibrio parahaemolyticus]TOF34098.1 hypothetical protein CGJ23_24500 [Vibrio parahaemolyticus]TOF44278.1 hypothetical protein CGJ21_24305 [Vibrio parahaemolyticus]